MQTIDIELLRKTYLYRPNKKRLLSSNAAIYWDTPIQSLLAHGYSFLPLAYSTSGYLFRGISSGFCRAVSEGVIGHSTATKEINQVERAMHVYFFSHDISDAITASDLHSTIHDNGIIAVKSEHFNDAIISGKAAIMAIGDAGFVFRYPLMTEPVHLENADFIITRDRNLTCTGKSNSKKIYYLEEPADRETIESNIKNLILPLKTATLLNHNKFPK